MQQFLLALLAPALLLSSCGQESPKKPAEKPKKEVKLISPLKYNQRKGVPWTTSW